MLENIILENTLVFDIETVPGCGEFDQLPGIFQELWEHKCRRFIQEDESLADNYFNHAGVYAEFGKVVCISAGFFLKDPVSYQLGFRVKSFFSKDEKEVLMGFGDLLHKHYNDPQKHFLCGHNLKEFDVPYLCRRMLVHGLPLSPLLDLSGKKPWEVQHVDTMALWKFGDYKSYTSLKLLAALFDIATPKDDIDGSDVGRVFWKEDNLPRIVSYCQKDVITVAQLLLKFKGLPVLEEDAISYA